MAKPFVRVRSSGGPYPLGNGNNQNQGRMKKRVTRLSLVVGVNLIILSGLLLFAEGVTRVLQPTPPFQRQEAQFIETSLAYLIPCARVGNDGRMEIARSVESVPPFKFPIEKVLGTFRIAVIGESSAAMLAAEMGFLLDRSNDENHRPELLDCSMPGSGLEHTQRRAAEVLHYNPDVVVLVFGHNLEFEYFVDETLLRIMSWRNRSRLATLLSHASTPHIEMREKISPETRLQSMKDWLREFAKITKNQNIRLVVNTVTTNLWVPPVSTKNARFAPSFLDARYHYARGNRSKAIEDLSRLSHGRNEALWHFTLGLWHARERNTAQASRHLRLAVDLETPESFLFATNGRDRAPSAVNEMIRSTAREETIDLNDTAQAVSQAAYLGLPGWDVMQDHCHILGPLMSTEARKVLNLLLDTPIGGTGPDHENLHHLKYRIRHALGVLEGRILQDFVNPARATKMLAVAVETWLRLYPQVTRQILTTYLEEESYNALIDPKQRARLLTGLAEACWNMEDAQLALHLSELARQLPSAEPWIQFGLVKVAANDLTGAAEAFQNSLNFDPSRPDAHFYLEKVTAAGGAEPDA